MLRYRPRPSPSLRSYRGFSAMHAWRRARLTADQPGGKRDGGAKNRKALRSLPALSVQFKTFRMTSMPESTRANICLDADGLSRTFLQEIRRLWTAPPHPLRAAFSAPSKTVSGLHGSIGLPSRLQPLQVAPVRPREVVLPWWFEHLAWPFPARASSSFVSRLRRHRFVGA